MMLNVQAQERVKETVIGVVTREVAQSSVVFKEVSQQKLEEKQAAEARKLHELRKSLAHTDVVDVAKTKVKADEVNTVEPAPNTAVAPQPVRGSEIDIKA